MSSIGATSYDGPKSDTQDSGFSFEDLFLSLVESVKASFAALSEPKRHELYQKIRSILRDAQQSTPSIGGTLDESGFVDDAADDDDNFPVFLEPNYQRDLKERWMNSRTSDERKSLALEGYRSHWNLGDSITLPDSVIKNLTACGKQVTVKAGWQIYLQELTCPRKSSVFEEANQGSA